MTQTGAGELRLPQSGQFGQILRATRPELIMTQCRGSFLRRPMNRNGARQRPYHALTAASSGFIPTVFSTRVRL